MLSKRGLRPFYMIGGEGDLGGTGGGDSSSAAAESTPAVESTPAGGGESSSSVGSQGIDWGELVEPASSPKEPISEPQPAPAVEQPVVTTAVEPQPAKAPAAEPQQPVQREAQPAAPVEPQPAQPVEPQQPVQQAPAAPELTPEQKQQQYMENRTKYVADLAQAFAIAPDDVEALQAHPEQVLPRLAAEVQVQTMEAVLRMVGQQLPATVQQIVQSTQVEQKNEQEFFDSWPGLNKPEYSKVLQMTAQTYRQVNPAASKEDFIKNVGIQAWVALGLPMGELLAKQGHQAAPVQTPAQVQTPAPAGYAPAGTASVAPPPAPAQPAVDSQAAFYGTLVEDI